MENEQSEINLAGLGVLRIIARNQMLEDENLRLRLLVEQMAGEASGKVTVMKRVPDTPQEG